jgi:hypothetical protein
MPATNPGAQYSHVMAYVADAGTVVLHTGGSAPPETWEWSGSAWSRLSASDR